MTTLNQELELVRQDQQWALDTERKRAQAERLLAQAEEYRTLAIDGEELDKDWLNASREAEAAAVDLLDQCN